jgi:2-dehydro-3-deoxygluconokinase
VVDTVGAGDAFVGGYLGALVAGQDTKGCLETGARLGALVCRAPGDWEGLLDWEGDRDVSGSTDVVR